MSETATIALKNGGHVLVDTDLVDALSQFTWSQTKSGYARRQWWEGGQHRTEWMHRRINQTPLRCFTDHINGNKLDNRRSNLRVATKSQNSANVPKLNRNRLTSAFKGVSLHRSTGLWRARIQVGGRVICGYFETQEDAAYAYNELAIKYFGEFAKLNPL